MPSANQNLQFAITDRAIVLERVKEGMRQDVFRTLKELEGTLLNDLAANNPAAATRTAFKQQRLERLLKQTQRSISAYTTKAARTTVRNLTTVAKAESQYLINEVRHQVGVDLMSVALSPDQVSAIASDALIEGAPSADWWKKKMAPDIQHRFATQVRQGMLRGETTPEIVRRIRGTRAKGFTDGIMSVPRHNAEALVRTSVQTAANSSRLETYKKNQDVTNGVQWSATLDKRTTDICMALHGKIWVYDSEGNLKPKGHDKEFPGPTAHWNCRSGQTPVLKSYSELSEDGAVRTGGRPTNFQASFEKNLRSAGMSDANIAKAKFNARASMDGQVARDMSFDSWLNSRSKTVQDQMLGKGRANLFRDGKISVSDLISQKGRPLPLKELLNVPGTPQIPAIANLSTPPAIPPFGSGATGGLPPNPPPRTPPPPSQPPPATPAPKVTGAPPAGQAPNPVVNPTDPRMKYEWNAAADAKWTEGLGQYKPAFYEKIPENVRRQMRPCPANYRRGQRAHYDRFVRLKDAETRGILQMGETAENAAGKRTLLHETGHHYHNEQAIASSFKVRKDFEDLFFSMRKRFLDKGNEKMVAIFRNKFDYTAREKLRGLMGITEAELPIGKVIDREAFGEFADIIGSLTEGRMGYGHTVKYYKTMTFKYQEVAAHMFTAVLDGNVYIEKFFPELLEFGRKAML